MSVTPRTQTPPLAVDTVAHGRFDLADQRPQHFTLVVFYRGFH